MNLNNENSKILEKQKKHLISEFELRERAVDEKVARNLEYIKSQTQLELGKLKNYNKENEFFVNQIH